MPFNIAAAALNINNTNVSYNSYCLSCTELFFCVWLLCTIPVPLFRENSEYQSKERFEAEIKRFKIYSIFISPFLILNLIYGSLNVYNFNNNVLITNSFSEFGISVIVINSIYFLMMYIYAIFIQCTS